MKSSRAVIERVRIPFRKIVSTYNSRIWPETTSQRNVVKRNTRVNDRDRLPSAVESILLINVACAGFLMNILQDRSRFDMCENLVLNRSR